jgi:hypothetical protein
MSDWQPIETAPKDGTPVWLWWPSPDSEAITGWWSEGWYEGDRLVRSDAGWVGNEASSHRLDEWSQPTHWMPLPAPPILE